MPAALPGYDEAAAIVSNRAAQLLLHPRRAESIDLSLAPGRVLARAIFADRDMPAFPRSSRDGFACRASEASRHIPLAIAGSIRAGDPPSGPLPPASAWEIMTGAAVPPGADAVAMLEHVENLGHGEQPPGAIRLTPPRTLDPGENVVPAGAEARAGDEIVPAGTRLNASHIAAAATCGYAALEVFPRPRVAILTTGDELVPVAAVPGLGQIRNSNAPMLAALVAQAGGDPWILPSAHDNAADLDAALREASQADLLLISGGVSAGKFDLVEPALAHLGAGFHFTGVRIQPGKPLVFGELPPAENSTAPLPFFGLPGNPISSAATFLLFAMQILSALGGNSEFQPRFALARLTRDLKGKPGLTRFVPSACTFHPLSGHPLEVAAVQWQGSGDLAAFARANCFIAVPEGQDRLRSGDLVRILPF